MGRRSRAADRPERRRVDAAAEAAEPTEFAPPSATDPPTEDTGSDDAPSRLRRRAQLLREIERAKSVRARLSPAGTASTRLRRPLRHV